MTWLASLPPACDCLRDYQRKLLADIDAALEDGSRRILAQAPTGSGQTHCISSIVAAVRAAGLRALIVATRTRIVRQLHERHDAFGVDHGVIAAVLPALNYRAAPVQIASVDTLYRRALVNGRMQLPSADIVVFDEAHLSLGESRVAILDQYPDAIHFGFTATPAKISGRPLRERYDDLILGPTVRQLIATGDLVRTRIFSAPVATEAELAGVDKDSKTGDYVVEQIGALMIRPKLVGNVIENWLRIANGRKTLTFACTKAHAAALVEEYLRVGVAAELLTDQTPEPEREEAIYRLETGATTVIVNCFLLSYGIDIPNVECIQLARPTRSLVLYLQAVGRGMRPAAGKDYVILIDHGRVVESLGMPDGDFGWSLDAENVNTRARAELAARRDGEEQYRTCPECQHMWLVAEEGPGCTNCGWAPAPKAKPIAVLAAELREITARAAAEDAEREAFYREALGWYRQRWPERWAQKEKSARWAAWMWTRERFELTAERPPSRFWWLASTPATAATGGWLRSRLIAFAKRRQRDPVNVTA